MADLGELIREWNSIVEKSKLLQLQNQRVRFIRVFKWDERNASRA